MMSAILKSDQREFKENPNTNNLIVDKIRKSEICEVAGVLAGAFKTNPAYSIIFQKENQREDGLLWLFQTNLFILNRKQALTNVIKEKTTGEIIGTLTVVPPQGVKRSLFVYSKIGIPRFISKFGIKPLIRMLKLDDYNKALLNESMKTSEYYYLHMVVVKEAYRGLGIGSFAVRYAVRELMASGPTCHLLGLTTQLPENTVFYSRLGFDKSDEGYVDFKGNKYYNCNMKLNL
ncbi:MAG: GNAT family N-acetyltransferase [Planctomycetaceae bacterium]|nr:GNAT family N-acetyltransferase [Planctomycetaceae bacterium]